MSGGTGTGRSVVIDVILAKFYDPLQDKRKRES